MPKSTTHTLPALDHVYCGDCLSLLESLPEGAVHLAFADPPFNIGYQYDSYDDCRAAEDYLKWSKNWKKNLA